MENYLGKKKLKLRLHAFCRQVELLIFSRFPWPLCFWVSTLAWNPTQGVIGVTKESLWQQPFAEPRPTLVQIGLEGTGPRPSHAEARMQRWDLLLQPARPLQRESSLLQRPGGRIVPWVPPGREEWGRKWQNILSFHSSSCCCPPRDLREIK